MKIFRGFKHPGLAAQCAVTIGNFDGVHRGHQAMLGLLKQAAAQRALPTCVLTFEPHPRDWFAGAQQKPDLAPARVVTLRDKLGQLARCGVQQAVVLPFNQALARQSPQAFIEQVLVQRLNAREVWVGPGFGFGRGRSGNLASLQAAGERFGFSAGEIAPLLIDGTRVSSTRIRAALAAGDFSTAARLLGQPYAVSGRVVHGAHLGRTLGYPTANLRFGGKVPALQGIYATWVHGVGGKPWPSVSSFGTRPTVGGIEPLLEAHLFDFSDDLYGQRLTVEFVARLRNEEKFPDLPSLVKQMDVDAARARECLAVHS